MATHSEDELREVALGVLTGDITREQLATYHREFITYAGVAIMLATRYMISDDDWMQGAVSHTLYDLLYANTERSQADREGPPYLDTFQVTARELGLYRLYQQGKRRAQLTPSPTLRELVEETRGNPAAQAFLKDMKAAQRRREERFKEREEKERVACERDRRVNAAEAVIRDFAERYGVEGLKVLEELVPVHIRLRS